MKDKPIKQLRPVKLGKEQARNGLSTKTITNVTAPATKKQEPKVHKEVSKGQEILLPASAIGASEVKKSALKNAQTAQTTTQDEPKKAKVTASKRPATDVLRNENVKRVKVRIPLDLNK